MNPATVMTDEQQIAIAKACGWTKIDRYIGQEKTPEGLLKGLKPKRKAGKKEKLPDYLNDLNAMHEAEKALKKSPLLWGQYCNTLGLLCGGARDDDGGIFVSHKEAIDATASQRAEALLRTLNLWKS